MLLLAAPAVPVGDGVAAPAADSDPLGETSVRMNPPARLALLLADGDGVAVADPVVPVALASAELRQPVTVMVCAESDRDALGVCPVGVCPAGVCAAAPTASAAENTVPNIS